MEKLYLLLGGRYDWAETNGGFSLAPETAGFSLTRATVKDQKVTFTFPDGAHGIPLHASASSSYEGGIKIQAFDKRLVSTLAFFEIDKSKMTTPDLNSSNQYAMVNAGTARSRGIEFDFSGAITKDLSLIGSYAYTDARFISKNAWLCDHGYVYRL